MIGVDAKLTEVVVGIILRLPEVSHLKAVGVYDYRGGLLGVFYLCLQGRGIHCHKHIAFVAGRKHLVNIVANMHLIAADTCQRALRSTYVGRIVGKGGDAVALCG